jgi:competence protein ComEC
MLLIAAAYALLTGFGEPVQRALAMTALFVAARMLARQTPALNALGITALVMLAISPRILLDASFQMTALAVLAIAGVAMPLGERSILPYARATRQLNLIERDAAMPAELAQFRVMLRLLEFHTGDALGWRLRHVPVMLVRWTLWAAELALVAFIVELAMTLPMAVWFHRIPLLALPANLIAMPLLMVLAPLAMIAFVAALISPGLALLPMMGVATLLHFAEWFAATLSQMHAAQFYLSQLRTPGPMIYAVLVALAMFFIALLVVNGKRRWVGAVAVAALGCAAIASVWPSPMVRVPQRLEITAIDVGQGDSIFAVTPDGHTLLVDAGGPVGSPYTQKNPADESTAFDIGEEVVSPYLWSRQVRRLDAVAITHAHSDHMGGMPAVLRNFHPRELWLGGTLDAPEEHTLLATAAQLGIPVRHWTVGARFEFGGLPVRVLWPPPQIMLTSRSANNDSLVLELDYGASRALLEGDAEAPSEAGMLATGALVPVTLLKVAHHGSKTSSTAAFLNVVAPRDAVISVGRVNPFGHPKEEVIDDFAERHVRLYRTDRMGAVTTLMDVNGNATVSAYTARSRRNYFLANYFWAILLLFNANQTESDGTPQQRGTHLHGDVARIVGEPNLQLLTIFYDAGLRRYRLYAHGVKFSSERFDIFAQLSAQSYSEGVQRIGHGKLKTLVRLQRLRCGVEEGRERIHHTGGDGFLLLLGVAFDEIFFSHHLLAARVVENKLRINLAASLLR